MVKVILNINKKKNNEFKNLLNDLNLKIPRFVETDLDDIDDSLKSPFDQLFGKQFNDKGYNAILRLINERSKGIDGWCPYAFHNKNSSNDIAICWGSQNENDINKGLGIAHILSKHTKDSELIFKNMDSVIKNGIIYKDNKFNSDNTKRLINYKGISVVIDIKEINESKILFVLTGFKDRGSLEKITIDI